MGIFKIFVICLLPVAIQSECCKPVEFYFRMAKDRTCDSYSGGSVPLVFGGNDALSGQMAYAEIGQNVMSGRCRALVCGDGKESDGTYCGRGSCNIFGCNCDGGCIPGDAKESFLKLNDVRSSDETIGIFGLVWKGIKKTKDYEMNYWERRPIDGYIMGK